MLGAKKALDAANAAGVTITLDGDNLALRAKSEPPAPVLLALRTHKAEIVEILRRGTPPRPQLGLACCQCGKSITEALPTTWGGLPCHRACGESAFQREKQTGAYLSKRIIH